MVARLPSFDLRRSPHGAVYDEKGAKNVKISMEEVDRILQNRGVDRAIGNAPTPVEETAAGGPTPASTVELSSMAQDIQRVKRILDETPDVREEQVQALKERIESGNYKVSGAEIADLIVRRAYADRIR